ncbi:MAG: hypothetical protein NC123_18255 [Butyrivibrio sp.]|nr:hypothetical protein [Acetatifactor muris]MCM1561455.1 hypothetical protein [Butyrivibrio sp.]
MKFTARIKDIGRTLEGNFTLTLESRDMIPAAAMKLSQVDKLDVEIKKHLEKRSLDANAYAWVLMSKIAQVLGSSKEEVYEEMLHRYGILYEDSGGYITVTVKASVDMRKVEGHWQLVRDNGTFKAYAMIKGSSQYDTKEMSRFIDGIVSDAKELDIETLPPDELERMVAAYGKTVERTHG